MSEPKPGTCPTCRNRHDGHEMVCTKCGTPLRGLCKSCGAEVLATDETCSACGEKTRKSRRRRSRSMRRTTRIAVVFGTIAVLAAAGGATLWWQARTGQDDAPWARVERGLTFYDAGEFQRALAEYEAVVAERPTDAVAWYMIGACRASLKMSPEQFVPPVEKALELDPNLPQAALLLASIEFDRGSAARAGELAELAASLEPTDPRPHWILARIELTSPSPNLHRALAHVVAARAAGMDSIDALLVETNLRLQFHGGTDPSEYPRELTQVLDDARSALDRGNASGLSDLDVVRVRAELDLAEREFGSAYQVVDGALANLDDDEDPELCARLLVLRARAWLNQHATVEALADFESALRVAPPRLSVSAVVGTLERFGMAEEARNLVARVAADGDSDGSLHSALAVLHLRSGNADAAIKAIARCRELVPDSAQLRILEGDALIQSDDAAAAITAYDAALQLAPDLLAARTRRALATLQLSNRERDAAVRAALTTLLTLESRHERDPEFWFAIHHLRAAAGRFAGARDAAHKLTELAPSDPYAWHALGRAWRQLDGRAARDSALAAFSRARRLAPDDTKLVRDEAELLLLLGEPGDAVVVATAHLLVHGDAHAVRAVRAVAYSQLGRWENSARDYAALATDAPDDVQTVMRCVEAERRAGRDADASGRLADAIFRFEGVDRAMLELLRAQSMAEANVIIERAAEFAPTIQIALLRLRIGDRAGGVDALRRIVAGPEPDPRAVANLVIAVLDSDVGGGAAVGEAEAAIYRLHDAGVADAWTKLARGRLQLARGDASAAATALSLAVDSLPGEPLAAFYLGEALSALGRTEEALTAYRRSVQHSLVAPGLRNRVAARLAAATTDMSDRAAGERTLREATEIAAAAGEPAIRLATQLQNRGEYAEAARLLDRVVADATLSAARLRGARIAAAIAWAAAGDDKRTAQRLSETADVPPAMLSAVEGYSLVQAGRDDDARRVLVPLMSGAEPPPLLAGVALATLNLRAGDASGTAAMVTDFIRHDDGGVAMARIVAAMLRNGGHSREAIEVLTAAVARTPDATGLITSLVAQHLADGQAETALALLRERESAGRTLDGVDGLLLEAHAWLLMDDGAARAAELARRAATAPRASEVDRLSARIVEAEAALQTGSARSAEQTAMAVISAIETGAVPHDRRLERIEGRARFVIGTIALGDGRFSHAVDQLDRSVALSPGSAPATNNLACALLGAGGNPSRALEFARRAQSMAPDDAAIVDTLASSALANGDPDEAEVAWKLADRLLSESDGTRGSAFHARVVIRLAGVLQTQGRSDEARERIELALSQSRDPGSEIALREALAR